MELPFIAPKDPPNCKCQKLPNIVYLQFPLQRITQTDERLKCGKVETSENFICALYMHRVIHLCASCTCLTSIRGAVSSDSVDRQVGLDVPRADDGHWDPEALDLCSQAVKEGLGGVLRCCV